MSTFELGGFAEKPEYVSDAYTEEEQLKDFESFNYCLAESYVGAMYTEDFELLGEADNYLFNNICNWINYDTDLGNEKLKEEIENGTLITKKGRTFLSAIAANKNISWGEVYTEIGVYNPSIIVMLIEQAGNGEVIAPITFNTRSEEELHEINLGVYEEIEKRFIENNCSLGFLHTIQRGYGILHAKKGQKSLKIPLTYSWSQALKKEQQ